MEIIVNQTIYPQFTWYWAIIVFLTIFTGIMLLWFKFFIFSSSFGVVGATGLIAIIGGAILSWAMLGPTWGALILIASIALTTIMFLLVLKTEFVKKRIAANAETTTPTS